MRPNGIGLKYHTESARFRSKKKVSLRGTDKRVAYGDFAAVRPFQTGDATQ